MRAVIPVACGALIDAAGAVLIARRPAGKIAAGKWEFPGGKVEPGESPRVALARELHEELGIEMLDARPLIRLRHDYSDRTVVLDTWLVRRWSGEVRGREAQEFAWVIPQALRTYDLLAADGPIVDALNLPDNYVFTPAEISEDQLLARLTELPRASFLRLRLPQLDDEEYDLLARRVIAAGAAHELKVMLDRDPAQVIRLGAAGLHLTAARADAFERRPLPLQYWVGGSAHCAEELRCLRTLSANFAVLGPVLPTSTHPQAPALGWDAFAGLTQAADLPVYAIGGVGPSELARVHAGYGQGTAGITAYWSSRSGAGGSSSASSIA